MALGPVGPGDVFGAEVAALIVATVMFALQWKGASAGALAAKTDAKRAETSGVSGVAE